MSHSATGGPAPEISPLEEAKARAVLALGRARRRLARRVEAVLGDLARGAEAEAEAERARWFVAAAARAPRGSRALSVEDWSAQGEDGAPRVLTLPLDPAKPPQGQIEAIFARARRMQRGRGVAQARLEEARAAVARIDDRLAEARRAETVEDALRAMDPRDGQAEPPRGLARAVRGPRKGAPARLPYRTFKTALGTPLYVARGAADNDALTFRVSRPKDLWLHAKGTAGAHVIVPLLKGKEPSSEALVDAAHLAAHFSDQRGEPAVEIAYALRGRVRKPRGSPPGRVVVDQAKTLWVRVEPERLKRLLASEETGTLEA